MRDISKPCTVRLHSFELRLNTFSLFRRKVNWWRIVDHFRPCHRVLVLAGFCSPVSRGRAKMKAIDHP